MAGRIVTTIEMTTADSIATMIAGPSTETIIAESIAMTTGIATMTTGAGKMLAPMSPSE